MAKEKDPSFFSEWIDSYYARDISELFGLRDHTGFLNLLKLMFHQSGGLVDITKLASDLGISRPTVKSYLEAMTIAHAIFPIQPFHGGGRREIVRRPKIYAFDTGFITFSRGWNNLRDEDRGPLWEHLVLDTLRSSGIVSKIHYWRDKSGHEIDFVLPSYRESVDTLECKMDPSRFNEKNLEVFRKIYPQGINWLVSPKVDRPYTQRFKKLEVRFISTRHILDHQLKEPSSPL